MDYKTLFEKTGKSLDDFLKELDDLYLYEEDIYMN